MSSTTSLGVAVVGLEFGSAFLPIYLEHPSVGHVGICDLRADRLEEVGDRLGITERFGSIEEVLGDDRFDAVHVATPVSTHADFAVAVLESGRHCACAVPMATNEADIERILAAERSSAKNYMMMETMVFSREYMYAKDMYDAGEMGDLTFLRGVHIQDLDGFARYWWGYPPMHYVTHALSPLLDIAGTSAAKVSCLGSGRLPEHLPGEYDNPFPLETAHFRLNGSHLAAEVTMAFFSTARPYTEGFSIYGDRRSFEWGQADNDSQLLFEFLPRVAGGRGRKLETRLVTPPARVEQLPVEIAGFTESTSYTPRGGAGGSFTVRNDHGGSHPHLVHEFVSSILEQRTPRVPGWLSANWTQPGISAHQSALADGELVTVPVRAPIV